MINTKVCSHCKASKSLNEFGFNYKNGQKNSYRADCKDCQKSVARARRGTSQWRAKNRAWKKARYQKRKKEQDGILAFQLKQCKYALTVDEYKKLLDAQGHVCALCGKINDDGKRLFVDHDHGTGVVRGLLCRACNWALGLFDNDPDWCRRAMEYLGKSKP